MFKIQVYNEQANSKPYLSSQAQLPTPELSIDDQMIASCIVSIDDKISNEIQIFLLSKNVKEFLLRT